MRNGVEQGGKQRDTGPTVPQRENGGVKSGGGGSVGWRRKRGKRRGRSRRGRVIRIGLGRRVIEVGHVKRLLTIVGVKRKDKTD